VLAGHIMMPKVQLLHPAGGFVKQAFMLAKVQDR
jgi:hypothetical protein